MLPYAAEFFGTFFFLSVILAMNKAIPVVIGLLASIYAFGGLSGGHFNTVVTMVMMASGKVSFLSGLCYIIAQILGGFAALLFFNMSSPWVISPVISL